MNKPLETSRLIKALADEFTEGDAVSMLKACYRDLVAHQWSSEATSTPDAQISQFLFIVKRCAAFLSSDFMHDALNGRCHAIRSWTSVGRLYRRIWRVYFFYGGTRAYVRRNCAFIRECLPSGNTNAPFRVKWVADDIPLPTPIPNLSHPGVPRAQGIAMFQHFGLPRLRTDIVQDYFDRLSGPNLKWKAGDHISLCVHPEIQMMIYLDQERLTVLHGFVGTSKPLCFCCTVFQREFDSAPTFTQATKSSRVKNRTDWLIPCPSPASLHLNTPELDHIINTVTEEAVHKFGYTILDWKYHLTVLY